MNENDIHNKDFALGIIEIETEVNSKMACLRIVSEIPFIFVLFVYFSVKNQQDDVTNCVFWSRDQVLAEQQKGPNFERKIGNFKRS